MRSVFSASLMFASVLASHNAQELNALSVDNNGYGLDVWAVTGKNHIDGTTINTWFFGLELITPAHNMQNKPSASYDDLYTTAGQHAVGNNGNVYFTYAQFNDPLTSSSDTESFSCSRVLSVQNKSNEYEYTDKLGYTALAYATVVEESISDAIIQNYRGSRSLSDSSISNDNTFLNQLTYYSVSSPDNQVSDGVWYANQIINHSVFLQQGYRVKDHSRKYNCVAQRQLSNDESLIPSLKAGETQLTFSAGYKIFESEDSTNILAQDSIQQLSIMVMDSALTLTASAIVAATSVYAF